MALGKVGPDARDAVPAIVLLFKDGDVLVRKNAAWSLGDISNDDPDAIRELLSLTRDTDYMVRLASVSSLGAIHSQPDCVVPVFIEMLNTPQVRDTYGLSRTLVSALAEFGPDAKAAIPTLIKMMQRDRRPDHPVDHALVAHALGEIGTGSDEALACLIDMLSKRHIFISAEAAGRALRKLNPDVAREMVPSLITQLEDSERSTHDKLSTTVRTLAGLGPLAEAAVPSLTMLLPQDDTCQIANALGEVGPASSSAVAMLVDCLQSYSIHHGYRTPYILALGKIGPGAKEAVPVVTQSLSEPDSFDPRLGWSVAEQRERWESRVKLYAWSLGQIGAASREAVPKLLELSNYIEKTIHVPTPDLLVRRSGVQEDWLITLEGQINQQTVSQVVLGALEQIQSAAAHDTR
jgi:HEAT repeat protein